MLFSKLYLITYFYQFWENIHIFGQTGNGNSNANKTANAEKHCEYFFAPANVKAIIWSISSKH